MTNLDANREVPAWPLALIAVIIAIAFCSFQFGVRAGHDDARCPTATDVELYSLSTGLAQNYLRVIALPQVTPAERTQFAARAVSELTDARTAVERIPGPACFAGGH